MISSQSGHPTLGRLFTIAAVAQVVWALAVLTIPRRPVLTIGIVGQALVLGLYITSRVSGIGFIAGLGARQPIAFTDAVCALAEVAAIAASVLLLVGAQNRQASARIGTHVIPAVALLLVTITTPAIAQAASAYHSTPSVIAASVPTATNSNPVVPIGATTSTTAHTHTPTALPTKPFVPGQPIDLSGVPGVTPEQQARAEELLTITLKVLPEKWATTAQAEAAGFRSIGDAGTGDEHYLQWDWINDKTILDPNFPESLVYHVNSDGTRTLEATMYMLPNGTTLDQVPDVGGALTQWHIHDNLCFTPPPSRRVIGLTNSSGGCSVGVKFDPVPMMHVWVVSNVCGPFASLEGVGAGQIKAGDIRSCDHVHGSTSTFG